MSGRWIIVSLQDESNPEEAYEAFPRLTKLAEWKTGAGGLDWLEELVHKGLAEMILDCDGYPNRYVSRAEHLLPLIQGELQALSELDALDEEAVWDLVIDATLITQHAPASSFVIEVWDRS